MDEAERSRIVGEALAEMITVPEGRALLAEILALRTPQPSTAQATVADLRLWDAELTRLQREVHAANDVADVMLRREGDIKVLRSGARTLLGLVRTGDPADAAELELRLRRAGVDLGAT